MGRFDGDPRRHVREFVAVEPFSHLGVEPMEVAIEIHVQKFSDNRALQQLLNVCLVQILKHVQCPLLHVMLPCKTMGILTMIVTSNSVLKTGSQIPSV